MKQLQRTHLFLILLFIFVVSGVFNIALLQHLAPSMSAESAATIRKEIIQVHSVLLAALLGGLFARPGTTKQVKVYYAIPMIVFSLVWALYIGAAWVGYPAEVGANGPNGLIDQFNDRASELSIVVSGALAYICNKT
jgi:Trk-type K+ transport system membrane component